MAAIKNLQPLFMILLITINSFLTLTTSASQHDQYYKTLTRSPKELGLTKRERLTHLHFYLLAITNGPNATEVRVAGPPQLTRGANNFGYTAIFDDPILVKPDSSSKKIGSAQGLYSWASQTEAAFLTALNFVFTEGEFNGSTLSVLGRDAFFLEVRELPIVGGSGAFRFARGFAQEKTYMYNATSFDTISEYNVYVLHY